MLRKRSDRAPAEAYQLEITPFDPVETTRLLQRFHGKKRRLAGRKPLG